MMVGDYNEKAHYLPNIINLGNYLAKGCYLLCAGHCSRHWIQLWVRHSLFMELRFSWEAKDKQIHDCDDCHKEKNKAS